MSNRITKTRLKIVFTAYVLRSRKQFKLTQQELAENVSTSLHWIQKVESGAKLPGFFLAVRLIIFLDIDANALISDLSAGYPIPNKGRVQNDPIPFPRR